MYVYGCVCGCVWCVCFACVCVYVCVCVRACVCTLEFCRKGFVFPHSQTVGDTHIQHRVHIHTHTHTEHKNTRTQNTQHTYVRNHILMITHSRNHIEFVYSFDYNILIVIVCFLVRGFGFRLFACGRRSAVREARLLCVCVRDVRCLLERDRDRKRRTHERERQREARENKKPQMCFYGHGWD